MIQEINNIFGVIQECDNFLRRNVEFGMIYTFWDFFTYLIMINKEHVIYWGNYMYFQ
jgi:hypothetical protein